MDLPENVQQEIRDALQAGIDFSSGYPLVEEMIMAGIAARFAFHTMTDARPNTRPVPDEIAGAVIMQMLSSYSGITGLKLAQNRHGGDDKSHGHFTFHL